MSGGAAGMNAPFAPGATPARDELWKRKLFALLLAFVIGFLLAWFLKKCPQPGGGGGGGGTGSSVSGGGGTGEKGSPNKLGQGSGGPGGGGGGGGGASAPVAGGAINGSGNGDGDVASGDAPSGKPGTGDDPGGEMKTGENVAGDLLIKSAEGKLDGKGTMGDTAPAGPPPPNLLSAHDFTYDSTGLPRYSNAVTGVASGLSTDTVRHKKSSVAAIVTTDSFDKVVDWYKSQMPAGWHASVIGDMEGMAKALSPDAIGKMLSGAMSGGPVDTASITAAQNGHKTGVAIFEPPNQTADSRGIMVMVKPGSPTQIVMSKKLRQ